MAEKEGFWKNLKKRLKGMSISNWINISIALLALFVSLKSCSISEYANKISEKADVTAEQANGLSDTANKISLEANKIAKETFDIQNTPRLFAYIDLPSYVGPVPDRIDDIVKIPIVISNNSNAFAYNVEADIIFADGSPGKVISLNEQQKKVPFPKIFKDRLTPGEQCIARTSLSTFPNAKENYASGKSKCKAKLQVVWKDVRGKEYKFINCEELKFTRVVDKQVTKFFWFDSLNNYSSIDNSEEVDKNWGLNIKY